MCKRYEINVGTSLTPDQKDRLCVKLNREFYGAKTEVADPYVLCTLNPSQAMLPILENDSESLLKTLGDLLETFGADERISSIRNWRARISSQ
jgi:hypothetical protein